MRRILLLKFFSIIHILVYAQTGSLDTSFDSSTGFNDWVQTTAIQSDGKILVAGGFTSYDNTSRNRIARLNPDGSLDTSFDSGTGFNNYVTTIVIQSDGKILVAGSFTSYNNTSRNRITRLNTDGSLDTSFDPGTGFSNHVTTIVIQSDGKIIVGGEFTVFNGVVKHKIARLNTDGSLDTSFIGINGGFEKGVENIAIQPDGKVIVGGIFSLFNDGNSNITNRNRIARLNPDGSLDTSFDPGTGFNDPNVHNVVVTSIAIQSDGKIIIGGAFTQFNGISRNRIVRLHTNGSLDTSFDVGTGFNRLVVSVIIQSDGKIIVGGDFFGYNNNPMQTQRIARLHTDGTLDYTFITHSGFSDGMVRTIALQSDDKIIVGGNFRTYDGVTRNRVARLLNCLPNISTDVISICESYTWIDGNTYSTNNNTATHTLTNSSGCDSVITLDLTINNSTTSTDVVTGCDNYTWIDGNTYFTNNNTAKHILTNAAGCDSIITLELTINNSTTSTDIVTTCENYTWIDGNTYSTNNNTSTYTLTNSAGCDSIINLDLTINTTASTDVISACESYTWIDGKTYINSNDTATYTLTNSLGCDSIITLNLTINKLPNNDITLKENIITANNANATYQWMTCDKELIVLPRETNQSFIVESDGYYAVEIKENGCVVNSDCKEVTLPTDCNPLDMNIYPNPTNDAITFYVTCSLPIFDVKVFNCLGQLISTHQLEGAFPSLTLPEESGVYFLETKWNKQQQVYKAVKH